jgi:flagellar basal-body rod protein FlgC
MGSISTIALSGMNAAARRIEVSASNVANAASTGALANADGTLPAGAAQAYAPLDVVQTASADGGTQTTVTTASPSTTAISDPQAAFANANGLVAAPNVDLSQEMIGQLIASRNRGGVDYAHAFSRGRDETNLADGDIDRLHHLVAARVGRRHNIDVLRREPPYLIGCLRMPQADLAVLAVSQPECLRECRTLDLVVETHHWFSRKLYGPTAL